MTFRVVYEGLQLEFMILGQKLLQVNGVPRSSDKQFATFFEAFDCFTVYYTFKSSMASRKPQANTITNEEVDKVGDEFMELWLAPSPTDLSMPRALLLPKRQKFGSMCCNSSNRL